MSRPLATPRWPIDEILARTDLAALLDEYAQPDQRPRRWHCPLPDHGDTHASVTMHRDQRGHERWRCWSGDDRHRGDAIDLIQAVRGSTRVEAIDELASRAGMHPERELPPIPERRLTVPPPATVLDERVVGITLTQLRKVRRKIVVAGGAAKHAAIAAALSGKWIDILVTDVNTATYLMNSSVKGKA